MTPVDEQLAALTNERNTIAQHGYILGYITASHPGNRPNFTQFHLREYGQTVGKYISKKRLPEVKALVERGQQIKQLDEAIAKLQQQTIHHDERFVRGKGRSYTALTNEPNEPALPRGIYWKLKVAIARFLSSSVTSMYLCSADRVRCPEIS
ncbi:MAG: hypothetical protein MUF49_28485 [Oculatellaceae cyanobacterium Prado106]|nr:hypothetical protein [Oculatellaceae cyanobacterium Prado106]